MTIKRDTHRMLPRPLVWGAVGVVLANLAIRGTWVALVHPPPYSDYAWYFDAATRLAEGSGYGLWDGAPTAYWPVGWPFILSVLFRLTGPSVITGLILQVLLSTATAVVVLMLAHRLTHNVRVAVAGGFGYTLLPSGWAWDSQLGSEQAFTLLTVTMLFLLAGADRWPRYAGAGAIAGAASLVRPTLLVFPAALLAIELLRSRGPRRAVAHTAAFSVALLAVIAPWTARNTAVLDSPVPVSTNGGVNLYMGTRTDTGYWWSDNPADNPLITARDEVTRNRLGTRLALSYWSGHPGRLVALAPKRLKALYSSNKSPFSALRAYGDWPADTARRWQRAADLVYWLLMTAAIAGSVVMWRYLSKELWLIGGFIIFHTALWLVFSPWDRFRFPLTPLFAVLAGTVLFLHGRRRMPYSLPSARRSGLRRISGARNAVTLMAAHARLPVLRAQVLEAGQAETDAFHASRPLPVSLR
ncbi:glycosyltransferase family 39 protein [Streptomyces himalayensis]|uniref:Glycosyltransferase family 39 protein n=1 Tax=Streptomyces himalayensis subsp. himalayensis TaxID=2756131 RepID=A0A7W0DQQ1_9ACTN|nr:glycosyltransferase family 39 protein [Streptomyces himalayensis]MBA2949512.1 glycosyltransferase family 39 protein [Streptomyces himalayensis subsp. himalayensis]